MQLFGPVGSAHTPGTLTSYRPQGLEVVLLATILSVCVALTVSKVLFCGNTKATTTKAASLSPNVPAVANVVHYIAFLKQYNERCVYNMLVSLAIV